MLGSASLAKQSVASVSFEFHPGPYLLTYILSTRGDRLTAALSRYSDSVTVCTESYSYTIHIPTLIWEAGVADRLLGGWLSQLRWYGVWINLGPADPMTKSSLHRATYTILRKYSFAEICLGNIDNIPSSMRAEQPIARLYIRTTELGAGGNVQEGSESPRSPAKWPRGRCLRKYINKSTAGDHC